MRLTSASPAVPARIRLFRTFSRGHTTPCRWQRFNGRLTPLSPTLPPPVEGRTIMRRTARRTPFLANTTPALTFPQSVGCGVGNPVYATSTGVVETAFVVSDATESLCDGSSDAGYQVNSNTSNLGNVILIAHPNGKFSLYGHLDCIWPGITPGVVVAAGTRIGNMGHSAFGQRVQSFTPHTHFEIKDRGVLGDPTNKGYSGYTTDIPDGYGYHDPRVYLNPFTPSSIAPVAVKVVASAAQNVLTGPDPSFAFLTSIAPSQEFVASAVDGGWYRIDLPNVNGPVSGWVQGSANGQALVTVDSSATAIQVSGASSSGLDVVAGSSSSPDLVAWDQT